DASVKYGGSSPLPEGKTASEIIGKCTRQDIRHWMFTLGITLNKASPIELTPELVKAVLPLIDKDKVRVGPMGGPFEPEQVPDLIETGEALAVLLKLTHDALGGVCAPPPPRDPVKDAKMQELRAKYHKLLDKPDEPPE